jgi:hypothetical protein
MRLFPLLVVACEPMPPSGDVLAPAPVSAPAPAAAPVPDVDPAPAAGAPAKTGKTGKSAEAGPQGDFDFDAEDRQDAPAGEGEEDPLALQARLLGLDEVPQPAPAAEAPAAPAPAPLPGLQAPVWDPTHPLPDASFGVRVLAVLLDMQPPRAVLGLPDGREQVVTPGAMLPAEGLVVLAIGRDAVQVAKITPSGFYARVDTQTVRALYPQPSTP